MGLANLVPGISGGTMLLAAGVYPRFIEAVAEVTTFRFKRDSLLLLAAVVAAAALAVLFLAGPIKDLVVHQRWIMYSLFIGLTLGGIPIIWRMVESHGPPFIVGAFTGLVCMLALAWSQAEGTGQAAMGSGFLAMLIAGVAGASAMILPGVSGGYLWLVLGVYIPILAGIEAVKLALAERSLDAMVDPFFGVILPVGLGVVIGIGAVSNVLRWVLHHYRGATLGLLLGLLVGAVAGLWPFQAGVAPRPGDQLKGQTVEVAPEGGLRLAQTGRPVKPEDYPTRWFTPQASQTGAAVGLILVGFACTLLVARLSAEDRE